MAVFTVVKTIGSTGTFSTPQLWEDGAPVDLTDAEKSAAGTFLVAAFIQGEALSFIGSGATGKLIDTDSTGAGNGTYISYGILTGNVAAADVATGGTSGATCVIASGTPTSVGCIWEGQCQLEEFTSAFPVLTMSGSVTSSTCYKYVTTVAGASFRNHVSVQSNALRYDAALGAAMRTTGTGIYAVECNTDDCRMTGLQMSGSGSGGRAFKASANGNDVLDFCILNGNYVATSTTIGVLGGLGKVKARNCLIVQASSAADHIVSTGTFNSEFYNCTMVAADDLATAPAAVILSGASGTVTVTNCGMFAGADIPTAAGSATFTFTTCSGDDATPATGMITLAMSGEFENVNNATRDFRLKLGANQIDVGTTDTTNAAFDIANTARPSGAAYDGGCWEYVAVVAAGGGKPPSLTLMGVM